MRTAYSNNLKNSMDMSCALCDAQGRLIAQGMTLPLHLGSIPDAMACISRKFGGSVRPGDVFILNDPYDGGTHLPDICVIMPVFSRGRAIAFSAALTHHQDVGGMTPASVPTNATEVYQEGIRVPLLKLRDGEV